MSATYFQILGKVHERDKGNATRHRQLMDAGEYLYGYSLLCSVGLKI